MTRPNSFVLCPLILFTINHLSAFTIINTPNNEADANIIGVKRLSNGNVLVLNCPHVGGTLPCTFQYIDYIGNLLGSPITFLPNSGFTPTFINMDVLSNNSIILVWLNPSDTHNYYKIFDQNLNNTLVGEKIICSSCQTTYLIHVYVHSLNTGGYIFMYNDKNSNFLYITINGTIQKSFATVAIGAVNELLNCRMETSLWHTLIRQLGRIQCECSYLTPHSPQPL